MSSQKLVRCEIQREDGSGRGVRYVPLEILGLWEHLMRSRHGLQVRSRTASVWVEEEKARAGSAAPPPAERVTELCLYVFDRRDGMLHNICRFLPTEELPRLRDLLLSHYRSRLGDEEPAPWLRERPGVWLRPGPGSGETGGTGAAHPREPA